MHKSCHQISAISTRITYMPIHKYFKQTSTHSTLRDVALTAFSVDYSLHLLNKGGPEVDHRNGTTFSKILVINHVDKHEYQMNQERNKLTSED